MSAEELEPAGPQELEKAITAHERWSDKLLAADDPGLGLPSARERLTIVWWLAPAFLLAIAIAIIVFEFLI